MLPLTRSREAMRHTDDASNGIQSRNSGMVSSSWWRPWRRCVAVVLATGVAALAFLYRFNALGGTFAGFENDHFAHLMRAELLLRGEQPLSDFADAELRGAWPARLQSETIAVSAFSWTRAASLSALIPTSACPVCLDVRIEYHVAH